MYNKAPEFGGDTINNLERMKLLDFVLNNLDYNNEFLNINTVINIRNSINNNRPFYITGNEKNILIDRFIKSNNIFDRNTCELFINDENCCKIAIKNDINSVNFAKIISYSTYDIISRALNENFILNYGSPLFLKRNFEVVKKSTLRRAKSVDYSDISSFSDEQLEELATIIVKSNYILSKGSKLFLKRNKRVALNSIKRDIKTSKYMEPILLKDKDIFKYLYINDYFKYKEDKYSILRYPIKLYEDEVIIKKYLREIQEIDDEIDLNNYSKIIIDFLTQDVKISDFNELFSIIAENSWTTERKNNEKLYNNIFSKITSELRTSIDYETSIRRFRFRMQMKDILGEKYIHLEKAMKEYYNIYASNIINKSKESESARNTISKLCALYVAKSKEIYKSRIIQSCNDDLLEVFIPNINNTHVYKIISHNMKRNKFYDLYENKDEEIINKIRLIRNKYLDLCDEDIIDKMVYNFIDFGSCKIENMVNDVKNYKEYVRYKKALKLINRLNRGYIKYNGDEVSNYKDIIVFDKNLDQYVYSGIAFTEKQIKDFKYCEYEDKIFSKIKRDISKLIDDEIVIPEINKETLYEYQYDFPFNDDYYVFDRDKYFSELKFIDILRFDIFDGSITKDNYDVLYDFLINKRMVFLFNLTRRIKDGYIINEINEEEILEIVKNFNNIEKMAKSFGYNLNNLKNIFILNKLAKLSSMDTISILGVSLINKMSIDYNYNEYGLNKLFDIAKELIVRMSLSFESTVPYIEGKTDYYNYSLYTNQDETILSSGIDTDSCFKLDGVDNDFLHYCALDKNGLVIKITDKYGNFVGRAAGFRNGNCLFLN